jgi:iron complex outermembrane receptor protein
MNGYEAGYRQLLGRTFFVDVAGFYNHYHNLFSEDIIGAPSLETTPPFEDTPEPLHYLLPAQFRNDLLGYTKGIEISPEWRPKDFWRLRGSYSFLHMNLTQAPGTPEIGTAPITDGSSPHHQVTVESALNISKTLELDLTYRYVSRLPAMGVPAYSTGDARFSWRFSRELTLSLAGRNLFQPYHFEFQSDPGPLVGIERSGYLSMTWTR